ncbi:hypothetical protein AB0I91_20050 [Actinosynnema sp. NPDC049800]
MDVLPCGHAAHASGTRGCAHLVAERPPDHYGRFTGVGVAYDRLCEACAKRDDPSLIVLCVGCAERVEDYSDLVDWIGRPEVRHRDGDPGGTWTTADCPVEPVNAWCAAAVPGGWLVLAETGLVRVDPTGTSFVAPVPLPAEPSDPRPADPPRPAVHASPDGRHAAVVTDFGRYGVVLDLVTGTPVLTLDRGDYRYRDTPFPLAFVGSDRDAVVVAATDWNRLDAFDLASGRLLTERVTTWSGDDLRPEHYLDYFHGALLVDPSGRGCWTTAGCGARTRSRSCTTWRRGWAATCTPPSTAGSWPSAGPGTCRWRGWTSAPRCCSRSTGTTGRRWRGSRCTTSWTRGG